MNYSDLYKLNLLDNIKHNNKIRLKVKILFTKLYNKNILIEIKCNTPNTT